MKKGIRQGLAFWLTACLVLECAARPAFAIAPSQKRPVFSVESLNHNAIPAAVLGLALSYQPHETAALWHAQGHASDLVVSVPSFSEIWIAGVSRWNEFSSLIPWKYIWLGVSFVIGTALSKRESPSLSIDVARQVIGEIEKETGWRLNEVPVNKRVKDSGDLKTLIQSQIREIQAFREFARNHLNRAPTTNLKEAQTIVSEANLKSLSRSLGLSDDLLSNLVERTGVQILRSNIIGLAKGRVPVLVSLQDVTSKFVELAVEAGGAQLPEHEKAGHAIEVMNKWLGAHGVARKLESSTGGWSVADTTIANLIEDETKGLSGVAVDLGAYVAGAGVVVDPKQVEAIIRKQQDEIERLHQFQKGDLPETIPVKNPKEFAALYDVWGPYALASRLKIDITTVRGLKTIRQQQFPIVGLGGANILYSASDYAKVEKEALGRITAVSVVPSDGPLTLEHVSASWKTIEDIRLEIERRTGWKMKAQVIREYFLNESEAQKSKPLTLNLSDLIGKADWLVPPSVYQEFVNAQESEINRLRGFAREELGWKIRVREEDAKNLIESFGAMATAARITFPGKDTRLRYLHEIAKRGRITFSHFNVVGLQAHGPYILFSKKSMDDWLRNRSAVFESNLKSLRNSPEQPLPYEVERRIELEKVLVQMPLAKMALASMGAKHWRTVDDIRLEVEQKSGYQLEELDEYLRRGQLPEFVVFYVDPPVPETGYRFPLVPREVADSYINDQVKAVQTLNLFLKSEGTDRQIRSHSDIEELQNEYGTEAAARRLNVPVWQVVIWAREGQITSVRVPLLRAGQRYWVSHHAKAPVGREVKPSTAVSLKDSPSSQNNRKGIGAVELMLWVAALSVSFAMTGPSLMVFIAAAVVVGLLPVVRLVKKLHRQNPFTQTWRLTRAA